MNDEAPQLAEQLNIKPDAPAEPTPADLALDIPHHTLPSGLIMLDDFKGKGKSQKADEDMKKLQGFFDGFSALEKRIPSLIKFAFKLTHSMTAFANEKSITTRQIMLGDIFWAPGGALAFDVTWDPYAIVPQDKNEFLKTGWNQLPKISERFPAILELVMTLGFRLSVMIDNKELDGKRCIFKDLHYFKNSITGRDCWSFNITQPNGRVKSSTKGF